MFGPLTISRIEPQEPATTQWESGVVMHGIRELEIDLGTEHWYGLGAMAHQRLPLERVSIPESQLLTGERATWGTTTPGLLGTLHPFWFNSRGVGIEVLSDSVRFAFNPPRGDAPASGVLPERSEGRDVEPVLRLRGEGLTIRIFVCSDAPSVVRAFWDTWKQHAVPPQELFEKPLWTTWAHFKSDISETKVLEYAREISSRHFPCSILGIDSRWQQEFGDCRFDSQRFPDPKKLVHELHEVGMRVSLWTVPFINRSSELFSAAAPAAFRTRAGDVFNGTWWEGAALFVDLIDPQKLSWHFDNLQKFAQELSLDGFKFDAGEAGFYCDSQIELHGLSPNLATKRYVEAASERFPWSDLRVGWRTQGSACLVRHWDKNSTWGAYNGLASCITQAITLNLLGYPFSFPDMIGGNEYGDERLDAELMIRWTQAVTPMPILQWSIPPWRFGDECASVCLKYVHLHQELVPRFMKLAHEKLPIVRPLWWIAPHDEVALCCEDQYLIGDDLLVAPVLHPGARSRDIYFPGGRWRSYGSGDAGEVYEGGRWVRGFSAELDQLPLFERV